MNAKFALEDINGNSPRGQGDGIPQSRQGDFFAQSGRKIEDSWAKTPSTYNFESGIE